jgi:hypothetical protein
LARPIVANVEEAARRLLRTLNEHQGHDREGATVHLGAQEARDAGLRPGSAVYRAAVWWLLDVVGALIPNEEANEQLRNTAGAQHRGFVFKITRHGVDLLRGV